MVLTKTNNRVIPRPSQWNLAKVQKWLENNPVMDDGDCACFLATVLQRIGAAARADAEKYVVLAVFNKRGVGKKPILWLIHTLIDNRSSGRRR